MVRKKPRNSRRKSPQQKLGKDILQPLDAVELEAIRIHNESEAAQVAIWNKRGHHGAYDFRKWEDIIEGFYKERVRKLAQKKLEQNETPKPNRRRAR